MPRTYVPFMLQLSLLFATVEYHRSALMYIVKAGFNSATSATCTTRNELVAFLKSLAFCLLAGLSRTSENAINN